MELEHYLGMAGVPISERLEYMLWEGFCSDIGEAGVLISAGLEYYFWKVFPSHLYIVLLQHNLTGTVDGVGSAYRNRMRNPMFISCSNPCVPNISSLTYTYNKWRGEGSSHTKLLSSNINTHHSCIVSCILFFGCCCLWHFFIHLGLCTTTSK